MEGESKAAITQNIQAEDPARLEELQIEPAIHRVVVLEIVLAHIIAIQIAMNGQLHALVPAIPV